MTDKKYSGLHTLLAGSFYQCWDEYDDRSPDEILDNAIAHLADSEIENALQDLKEIFKLISLQIDFNHIIGTIAGCNYDPNFDGVSDVEWLVEMKRKLQKTKTSRSPKNRES